MLITRTPLRVSFLGGGTDLPWFSNEHEGLVISTSIDKYVYLTAHPLLEKDQVILKYSKTESVGNPKDLKHPIARTVLSDLGINGIDIGVTSDLPAGTGMGSSSAFTVGLGQICHAFLGRHMSARNLAEYACKIELDILKEPIGKQDQVASAFGGLNLIYFSRSGDFEVKRLILKKDVLKYLAESLVLIRFGGTRSASSLLKKQADSIQSDKEKLANLVKLRDLTEKSVEIFSTNPEKLGSLLWESWKLKHSLSASTENNLANQYIEQAMSHGASGGKLLGAGEAGFILLQVPPARKLEVLQKLGEPSTVDFKFESLGSTIIYDN